MASNGGQARGRRRARLEDGDHYENQEVDRISCIPDGLAHHILSFLPEEDVARTSVLSKRWKSIWRTRPGIDYDETRFENLGILQCRQEFLYSMCRFFLSRDIDRPLIQNIRVFAVHPHDEGLELFLNLFIDMAISESKLLDLSITIDNDNSDTYENSTRIAYGLPDIVFTSGTHLTSLMLKSCSCGHCENVKFPSLKTMSLNYVLISDEMLKILITNSPMLEDLDLLYCFDMVALRVFNSNLRHLVIGSRSDLMLLEIDVPNLCLFSYNGIVPHNPHPNDNNDDDDIQTSEIVKFSSPNKDGFKSLKTVNLAHVTMEDDTIKSMLSTFRFINTAKLHCCSFRTLPFMANPGLKSLEMEDCMYEKMIVHSEALQYLTMMNNKLDSLLRVMPAMHFDNLKALELAGYINFESESLILSSWPRLETLIVRSCFLLKDLSIAVHSLKSLTVQSCFSLEEAAIDTPNLQFLKYNGCVLDLLELNVPDDVVIELCLIQQPNYNQMMQHHYQLMLWNFYQMFEYTRYITIEGEEAEFAVPQNMAQLASDRGPVLVHRHDCVWHHLIQAEIANFRGSPFDRELVHYLRGHARYLNSLIISFRGHLEPDVVCAATVAVISIPKANPFAIVEFKYN